MPRVRVLVLTTFELDDYVYAALRAGASGFLTKDVDADDLCQAIRLVAAGHALFSPSVTRTVIDAFAAAVPEPKPARAAGRPDRARGRGAAARRSVACPTMRSPAS